MSINLLLVSPYSQEFYGGVQNQLTIIQKSLPENEFNIKFLSPDTNDFNFGRPIKIPFNGSVAPIKLLTNKKTISKALAWADIVHIHEPFIPIFLWRIPINNKTIVTHHASLSNFLSSLQKKAISAELNAFKITAVSHEAAAHSHPKAKIDIIPNTIVDKNPKQEFTGGNDFLFIGRNEKRKNFKLYENYSNLTINKKYKFRAITNKSEPKSNISIYRNPNETLKSELLTKSSIYIAPNTHGESFGITIIEAINSGCIAVCSDLKAFKDLLGDSGVYFENNNLDSLLSTTQNLFKKDLNSVFMNQKKYIEKYMSDKVIPSWISLYTQI